MTCSLGGDVLEAHKPLKDGEPITLGSGKSSDPDEAHPERTVTRPVRLRRVEDRKATATLGGADERAVRSLVERTLSNW